MKWIRLVLGVVLIAVFVALNEYLGFNHWSIWAIELLLTLTFGFVLNPIEPELKEAIHKKTLELPKLAQADTKLTEVDKIKRRLELVIEGTNDGIWDWNILKNQVFWSERVYKITGTELGFLEDSFDPLKSLMEPLDKERFEKELRGHLVYNTPFHIEVRIRPDENSKYNYFLIRGKVKHNQDGKPVRMAGSISDISKRKTVENELRHNAYHDSVTNLYNRNRFIQMLMELQSDTFDTEDRIFGLIFLDIDNFKNVNDNYGYSSGDQLLQELGSRLKNCLREGDELARIGGDEFVILVSKIRHAGDATQLASKIRVSLQKPFYISRKEIVVSACQGIVFSSESDSGTEMLLRDANTVMAVAKKKGSGVIEVFKKEMREDIQAKFKLEYDLRHAIKRGELYLVYQPIYRLDGTKLIGFEALIRWQHPDIGNIPPTKFIPLAEDTGLILPIGEWVFRTATKQMKNWLDQGFDLEFISINVAAQQLFLQDIPSMIHRITSETKIENKYIKMEITESAAMNDVEKMIQTLNKISAMGIRISIDDFGTGYSSLAYLKRFPINTLKVDRSFVMDIPHDQDSMSIASTIIAMAKTLNLDIIAEGVEEKEQIDFLIENGCDNVQGFYFSKPLFVEESVELLKTEAAKLISIANVR
jgi:diguanylate cyclase (GGDEF)-like protein